MPSVSPNPSEVPLDVIASEREVHWLTKVFASGLYSGYSPIASGTVGSAVALAIYFIPGFEQLWVILPICLIVFFVGVKTSHAMEQKYGHDPAEVTIDEVIGMWISLLLLPKNYLVAGCAFFLFRILDIVKPFPARKFDSVLGGMGIMMDDVIAGLYTNFTLQVLVAFSVFEKVSQLLGR